MTEKFLVQHKHPDARQWSGAYVYGLKEANRLAAKLRATGHVTDVLECWRDDPDELANWVALLRASKQASA
jgi:DNA polymerase III delta subunit